MVSIKIFPIFVTWCAILRGNSVIFCGHRGRSLDTSSSRWFSGHVTRLTCSAAARWLSADGSWRAETGCDSRTSRRGFGSSASGRQRLPLSPGPWLCCRTAGCRRRAPGAREAGALTRCSRVCAEALGRSRSPPRCRRCPAASTAPSVHCHTDQTVNHKGECLPTLPRSLWKSAPTLYEVSLTESFDSMHLLCTCFYIVLLFRKYLHVNTAVINFCNYIRNYTWPFSDTLTLH